MLDKKNYYQGGGGVNEPTPGKKKYKSEPSKPVKTRFKTPFFRNYDYVDSPTGPGTGLYQHMENYKSVDDFLKKTRKRNKGKYTSEDQKKKQSARKTLLNRLIKNAIDFPLDDQVSFILPDSETYLTPPRLGPTGDDTSTYPGATEWGSFETYPTSVPVGGVTDSKMSFSDFESKSPDALDFGRDYTEDLPLNPKVEKLIKKYLNPAEPDIYGLPGDVVPFEDLDAPSNENPFYGIIDDGNTTYKDVFI